MSIRSRIAALFRRSQPDQPDPPAPSKPSGIYSGVTSHSAPTASAYSGWSHTGRFADSRSGGAKYAYGLSSYAPHTLIDHFATRQQARDAYHETPQARQVVDRFADTVVDVGLKLEAEPQAGLLGIDPEQAEQWGHTVEERFDAWARTKLSHRREVMSFYQLQRLYAIAQQRDNDQFVRLYHSDRTDLPNPLQVDLIDPNQIRGHAWTSTYAQFDTFDGIERDAQGREERYRIWSRNPKTGKYDHQDVPHIGRRSKLYHMLHGFYSEYAGQGRGYSRLAHALQDFEKVTDFTVSAVQKAINDTLFSMAVENAQMDPSNPLEDVLRTQGGAGPASQQFGSDATPGDEGLEAEAREFTAMPNYTPLPEATAGAPGIGIFNLQRGDVIKELGKHATADSFNTFIDTFTSHIAAAHGMPVEVALMRFNQNYSASRASLILFWRIAMIWQMEMATDFLNPVYEMFLTHEIAAGRLSAPGWSDPRLRQAWLNCRWIGAPMPNIDPQRTANADRMYLEMGATTHERIARNLNGSSFEANKEKLRREHEDYPVPPWGDWTDDAGANDETSDD